MTTLRDRMDRAWYPSYEEGWDVRVFKEFILERLRPEDSVLDYGAGRGVLPETSLRGKAKFVAGVDPDKVVFSNPLLDEAKLLEMPSGRIPYEDRRFDIVCSRSVLEHVLDPPATLREIKRVLKPGGYFICRTPGKYHYVPLVAQLTPHAFHQWWLKKYHRRDEEDTFPTVYRCNTPAAVERCAAATGMQVVEIRMLEGRPEYLRPSPVLYPLGMLYERLVSATPALASFRAIMLFCLRNPLDQSAA